MTEPKINRTKHLHVRFTDEEFHKISSQFSGSTCRKLSEYIRKKLLDKSIKIYHRNQSLDDLMAVLILLKDELNAIANNYNQVVKKLHTMDDCADLTAWLPLHEVGCKILSDKITEIKSRINQINDQWLQ
ncbi:plasmid mobilization protein [Chitinophaga sp. 30R24]|uniref:plasmid mobilization protein n=1 Tax=Chitinophaga sp. 30R24 TaxID=3248838 RepID=UPI003B901193